MVCAMHSLPVPLSPNRKIVASVGATRYTIARSSRMRGLSPCSRGIAVAAGVRLAALEEVTPIRPHAVTFRGRANEGGRIGIPGRNDPKRCVQQPYRTSLAMATASA